MGVLPEFGQTDIPDTALDHMGILDVLHMDDLAGDGKVLNEILALAQDGDMHVGAGVPAQFLDRVIKGHVAGQVFFDLDDAVPRF